MTINQVQKLMLTCQKTISLIMLGLSKCWSGGVEVRSGPKYPAYKQWSDTVQPRERRPPDELFSSQSTRLFRILQEMGNTLRGSEIIAMSACDCVQ